MTFEFHEAKPEHIDELIRLNDFIQKQHAEGDPAQFRYPLDKEKVRRFFSRVLDADNNHIFLAIENKKAGGYVWFEKGMSFRSPFTFQKSQILVHHIFVHTDYRRCGIAKRFFDIIGEAAQAQNCEEIILNTYMKNIGAQAFFQSIGFESTKLSMKRVL